MSYHRRSYDSRHKPRHTHDANYKHSNGYHSMLSVNRSSHYQSTENRYIPADELKHTSLPSPSSTKTVPSSSSTPGLTPVHSANSLNITKIPPGTDPVSGVNAADANFTQLMLHMDFQRKIPFYSQSSLKKNYKVILGPDKSKKVRLNGEGVSSAEITDPRRIGSSYSHYLHKPNKKSKKFPFKQLPQPRFIYDKDSLGPAPPTDLVVWGLPPSTNEVYIMNFFQSYGDPIKDIKFINDPDYAVPLGVVTFTFAGSADRALRSGVKLLKSLKAAQPKIDGVDLKIGFNDSDSKFLNSKIEFAREKLRMDKFRRDEEEKKKLKRLEEEQRREKEEQLKKEKEAEEERRKQPEKLTRFAPNTTMASKRFNNRVTSGIFLPKDLNKYIKDRPYILIHDKWVPTNKVTSQDIKDVLNKYGWTRVLSDRTGFYIVFNSLKECERCFFNEDGRRFFEFRLFMELAVPENFVTSKSTEDDDDLFSEKKHNFIDEATNLLIKEFQSFLAKDIRERVIAPYILDLLNPDRYPELMKDLKEKESTQVSAIEKTVQLKQNALSVLAARKKQQQEQQEALRQRLKQQLPSFTKKVGASRPKKKALIPMQHALNYDESDSDEEDSSRSATPTSRKRDLEKDVSEEPKKKKSKLTESFLYDESDEEEVEEEEEMEVEEVEDEDLIADERYKPTFHHPCTVYEDEPSLEPFDLDKLCSIIKDDEDLALAQSILKDVKSTDIENIDYWAWKQRDSKSAVVLEEAAEDGIEASGPLSSHLECSTGSFRSEGYRKIKDADKVEYLPHRRKIHKPLKTVQHDDDEANYNTNNNIQSSRVNRANNRRFAADISAQKQMLGSETDILNLNALTKRKKPVSFARSAIHNWGLYALEPIAAKEMIIEYVGESIRQQVAEHREKSYLKTGIGSSYLFRIDENTVVDATKKGGIARFINHCCNPSCTAKIIKVEGKKRIVIYALRDIDANEELTYDYKFERETNDDERIRCLCGAPGCKGYLN